MIWLILLIGLILRVINLNQSLWWDEAINVFYAKSSDFWYFITTYPIGDFHPPGYFFLIWIWGRLFDFSESIIRIPSVIFGILTIDITFLIGRELFSRKIGLWGALFLALAPLHIYYSQEARMYAFAAFAVTISSYFLLKMVEGKKFSFWGYVLSICLVLYSDYVAYFILPAHLLFILAHHKRTFKKFLLAISLGIFTFLIWLPFFAKQIKNGIDTSNLISGWSSVVGGAGLKNLILLPAKVLVGRINIDNNLIYALLLGILSVPYLIIFKKGTKAEKNNFLLFWLLIPPSFAFLVSFFLPVFNYFRLLFILPALYLLLAASLDRFNTKIRIVLMIWIVLFEILTTSLYIFNPKYHREDWKGAVNFINQNANSKTLVLHKNKEIPAVFSYYALPGIQSQPAFRKIPVQSENELADLAQITASFNRIFLFDYLVDITDSNRILEKQLMNLGFSRVKDYDFRGVGFIYEFEK